MADDQELRALNVFSNVLTHSLLQTLKLRYLAAKKKLEIFRNTSDMSHTVRVIIQ